MTKVTITLPERRVYVGATSKKVAPLTEEWERTSLHCPRCGKQAVCSECSGGDYYVGPTHICTACRGLFYLPSDVEDIDPNTPNAERADALASKTRL